MRAVKALLKREIVIDYLFVDPPYHKIEYYDLVETLVEGGKLSDHAIIMCEHSTEVTLPENYGVYKLVRQETYGSTIISIYRHVGEEGEID